MSQDTTPLVSVIVPVYNAARFLDETIKSLQDQTYTNWEAIFIDDKSTDNSIDIVNQYKKTDARIKLIQMKQNSGAALSRNAGTAKAKGHYLAFLDADDLWAQSKLHKQIDFMQKNKYIFTFTGYEFADENGMTTGKRVRVPVKITYRQAIKNHIISTPGVMFDLKAIDRHILMMPNVRSGQDAATWWQVLKCIDAAYSIDEPLFMYRRTGSSLSANKFKALKRTWYLFRKVEKINLFKSSYYFVWYGFNAVKKRI